MTHETSPSNNSGSNVDTSVPSDPALYRARLEEDTKRLSFKYDLRKVIYGTMIVGVAAAIFPFAQKVAELTFNSHIEQAKQKIQSISDRRTFMERLALEGRSNDIETRIRLAEFYSFLAGIDESEKTNWREFRQYLLQKKESLNKQKLDLLRKCRANEDDPECLSVKEELRQIDKYTDPANNESVDFIPCDYSRRPPQLNEQPITSDGLLLEVSQCRAIDRRGGEITPIFIVVHASGRPFVEDLREYYTASNAGFSATHILIGKDGGTAQMDSFLHWVFHIDAGVVGIEKISNANSISITLSGHGNEPFPSIQVETAALVVKKIQEQYNIPVGKVVRVSDVADTGKPPRNDTGPQFPWETFVGYLEH